MEPQFKPGDLVVHPLGFKCMVAAAYVKANRETKNEDGTSTKEEIDLEEPLYELEYFTETSGLQKTRLGEKFIVGKTE